MLLYWFSEHKLYVANIFKIGAQQLKYWLERLKIDVPVNTLILIPIHTYDDFQNNEHYTPLYIIERQILYLILRLSYSMKDYSNYQVLPPDFHSPSNSLIS